MRLPLKKGQILNLTAMVANERQPGKQKALDFVNEIYSKEGNVLSCERILEIYNEANNTEYTFRNKKE